MILSVCYLPTQEMQPNGSRKADQQLHIHVLSKERDPGALLEFSHNSQQAVLDRSSHVLDSSLQACMDLGQMNSPGFPIFLSWWWWWKL